MEECSHLGQPHRAGLAGRPPLHHQAWERSVRPGRWNRQVTGSLLSTPPTAPSRCCPASLNSNGPVSSRPRQRSWSRSCPPGWWSTLRSPCLKTASASPINMPNSKTSSVFSSLLPGFPSPVSFYTVPRLSISFPRMETGTRSVLCPLR